MAPKKEDVEGAEAQGDMTPPSTPVAAIPVGVGTSGANTGGTFVVQEQVTPAANTVTCPRCEAAWDATDRSGTTIPCTCGFLVSVA